MGDRVTAIGEQTTLSDRKRRAGQRMIIGLESAAVDEDFRRIVAEIRPAGFILFARNVEEPRQVLELNRELASLCDAAHPALLCVDQEGGRVQRIRDPATVWPPMGDVGRSEDHTSKVSSALARELRAMGFNLNFAPVADVDSNPDNPIIGNRAFSSDPQRVGEHVAAFIRAHEEAGLISCAKHFPGHGDTNKDSHVDLPCVERDERDIRHVELTPFKAAIEANVPTVMSAHVVFKVWDEVHPATLSCRVLEPILRKELGFQGLIFSDDMDMAAVAERYSVEEQVRRGTSAGIDVFLCCNKLESQWATFRELMYAQECDVDQERRSIDAMARVHALRERFLMAPPAAESLEIVGCAAHRDLASVVKSRGERG